ncbi:hypothetical protein [Dysgonomonas sp. 511]|uniref:hypothetical protein n=1 Tax=Dysgonomonas sp. 511 TaxID=2302930 RepID=UPI0013D896B5|nr:hypothetical protein [Dysgonomonas sp. 511]NDV77898.1 hypothetical protein [Dysgonomonas sp. 511]
MENLQLNYGASNSQRATMAVLASYFALFGCYVAVLQLIAKSYNILFFGALILFVLALFLVLKNTAWKPAPVLEIDTNKIESNLPGKKKISVEWVNVSKVNIGTSYFVFLTNGEQKQRDMDLSDLRFSDLKTAKSKIIELCEHKNIPYHND